MATHRKIKDISPFDVEGNRKKRRKRRIITVIVAVLILAVAFGAVWVANPEIFNSKKTVTVEVHHSDGLVETFEITTKKAYLDGVLKEEELASIADDCVTAAGREGKEIAHSENGDYWVLYVGDELSEKGVSQVPVEDGKTYKLVFTRK